MKTKLMLAAALAMALPAAAHAKVQPGTTGSTWCPVSVGGLILWRPCK